MNNGLHSNQETFPQQLICLEIAGLHSIRIAYIAEHSPQECRHPKLSKKCVTLTGTWSKLRLGALPSVDLRAVCFVRAICTINMYHLVRQDHNG